MMMYGGWCMVVVVDAAACRSRGRVGSGFRRNTPRRALERRAATARPAALGGPPAGPLPLGPGGANARPAAAEGGRNVY
eukprot:scaffold1626_cov372-Prasinococcus_capsulatus_cf.AAC.1